MVMGRLSLRGYCRIVLKDRSYDDDDDDDENYRC